MSKRMMFSRRELLHGAAIAGGSALAFGAFPQLCTASALPQVTPGEIQIDPRRLQVAYDLMEKWTTGPKAPVPGGAILVGRFGKILAPHFFGRQGPEPDAEPIRNDAMFYMASVTKPVIFTAAMLLVERGQLNLNDPVSRYVPEFTGQGREKVLVLHLFTHTSGLPDELPRNGELRSRQVSLARFVEEILKTELLFAPGTQFSYSSSGTILTAEIVQRLSGRSIRDFVRTQILEPLEMRSSGLGAQGFAPERLVRTTVPDYQIGNPGSWNTKYWREFGSPAGGLFSTPEDYARICVMMLGGGKLGDVRLLSPASVRMMTTNRSNDLPDLPETTRRTQPWGLGWRLNHPGTSESWSDLLSRKVFGHTGSAGNIVWMDPQTQTFCVILTNYLRSRAPWRLVHLSNAIAAAIM